MILSTRCIQLPDSWLEITADSYAAYQLYDANSLQNTWAGARSFDAWIMNFNFLNKLSA